MSSVICSIDNVFQLRNVGTGTRNFAGLDKYQSETKKDNSLLSINFSTKVEADGERREVLFSPSACMGDSPGMYFCFGLFNLRFFELW